MAGMTSSCTLTISTQNAHPNGYIISSASGGIQEAINDAWVSDSSGDTGVGASAAAAPYIKLMAGTEYSVYATLYLRGNGSKIDGTGGMISCYTRDYCGLNGSWRGHPVVDWHSLLHLFMVPRLTGVTGCSLATFCNVSSFSSTNGIITVTTSASHSFKGPTNGIGADLVDCEMSTTTPSLNPPGIDMHFASRIQAVTATTFTVALDSTPTFSAGAYTFGFCRPLQAAWEDNGDHTLFDNFQTESLTTGAYFGFGIVNENDQHAVIRTASSRGSGGIDATYPVSAFFYQRTDRTYAGIMNISDAEISGVNCYTGGGNGLVWSGGSVCQGFPVFGVRYFGGYQGATLENVYQDASSNNPLYGSNSTAAMGYLVQGGNGTRVLGTFPTGGAYPVFNCSLGSSQPQRNYYVLAWNGTNPSPVLYIGSSSAVTGTWCGGVNINLTWPSPKLSGLSSALTWSILFTTGTATVPPHVDPLTTNWNYILGSSTGGSTAPVCGASGMCTWTDTQGTINTYTVPPPLYPLPFWFWPVPFVNNGTVIFADIVGANPSEVSSNGAAKVSIIGLQCIPNGSGNAYQSAVLVQCLNVGSGLTGASVQTQLSTAGAGPPANSKGLWNLGPPMPNIGDLVTLEDSNFGKTYATYAYRPLSDAPDMAIGKDQFGGLNLRAANSVSFNISSIPTGSNFSARITSNALTLGASSLSLGASVAATDAGVSRSAAGVTAIGNGTAGDETGYVRSANTCAVTSDISLPVGVTTTVCQFSNLPASAKNWALHCYLPWIMSSGTGTNSISIGVNASQIPTARTEFAGVIYSTTNTAPVNAVVPVSTSGAKNILTITPVTPSSMVFPAYLDGSIAASATAGTFSVTMTASGTTVTAATTSGAYCELK